MADVIRWRVEWRIILLLLLVVAAAPVCLCAAVNHTSLTIDATNAAVFGTLTTAPLGGWITPEMTTIETLHAKTESLPTTTSSSDAPPNSTSATTEPPSHHRPVPRYFRLLLYSVAGCLLVGMLVMTAVCLRKRRMVTGLRYAPIN